MADTFRIEKHALRVECCDVRGECMAGEFFVATQRGRAGEERLQDLLATRRFVPLRHEQGLTFLSTSHLIWIRLNVLDALGEIDGEAEGAQDAVSADVEVVLDNRERLHGFLRYLMPEHERRLSDYLARVPPFFPLRTGDWLYLLNRDRVLQIQAADGGGT